MADHWAQIKNNSLVSTALAINACRIAGRLRSLPLLEVNRRRSFSIHGVVRNFSTRSEEQEWHFSCSFMSFAIFSVHRKNKTFRAGRSSLLDYTLIVLKILKPLSAVLIITPGNCRCQWTSFTSFWPWNKTTKKWATFLKKRKMPKNMSRRKNKWKNKRRNINRGNFLYVHPPHHPWVPFTLPHTSTLRIFRSRGRFNLHLPEFQLLCLWRCTGKPRYGHSIEGLSVVCVSLFSHFCFWDLKTRVPFS